jgi:DNA mismatch repair ATPase MutS
MEPLSWYRQNIEHYTTALAAIKKKITLVAAFRLLGFIGFLISGYYWLNTGYVGEGPWLPLVLLIAFVLLVRTAFRMNDRKALLEKLLFINHNEEMIMQHEENALDDGDAFLRSDNYAADLDIFGPASLFHLLNRTSTQHGAQELAGWLQQPSLSKQVIEQQQQAVQQLSRQQELRQLIMAHGLLHGEAEGNLNNVSSWLQRYTVLHGNTFIQVLRMVLPLYNMAALIVYLATDNYGWMIPGIMVSWFTIGIFARKINDQHTLLGKKQSILEQYASILMHFNKVDAGSSVQLQQQQATANTAHKAIKQLSRLAALFDQRLNLLVNIFLNSFFMYDIQCLWALESWKKNNAERFNDWIHCVGTIEGLNSLATFAFNNPSFQYPVIATGKPVVTAKQLAHPLIAAGKRVANDFAIGEAEQLMLVTGSNMSGKTTFLRTLGVNLVLAQCGAPVCATTFRCTPMTIQTSIRVSDSLQENTSYFMAELKRLQQIVHHLQQNQAPTLVLIDEILRGTNSEDKTHGSEQFIKKLLQYNSLTLFATHDLALSRLEGELPQQVTNYCFESVIRDGELLFDYTLQRGVAKNKNASFLMQKMDII